jgi:hypothetical protein
MCATRYIFLLRDVIAYGVSAKSEFLVESQETPDGNSFETCRNNEWDVA